MTVMYYVKYKMPLVMDSILLDVVARRGGRSQISAPSHTFLEKMKI
jgi:hypothetical protein